VDYYGDWTDWNDSTHLQWVAAGTGTPPPQAYVLGGYLPSTGEHHGAFHADDGCSYSSVGCYWQANVPPTTSPA